MAFQSRSDPLLFTYESFTSILEEIIKHGYTLLRVDEDPPAEGGKSFYLRHDVDISALAAARVGEIERSLGVVSSFFFLLGADTYNLLDPSNLRIVEKLRSFGHCVGLHIDERIFGTDERIVRHTLAWFKECVGDIDAVVSFHRPTAAVLHRDYAGFMSAYRPAIFSDKRYLSDSRRSDEFYPRLQAWFQEGRSPIQLLLHPEWWYPEQDITRFKSALVERRVREIEGYLSTNFSKVFGESKGDEDRTFGL